jgi:hypothetical protein
LKLFHSVRPELATAPVVEALKADEFSGVALAVVRVAPPWVHSSESDGTRPFIAEVHEYIRSAGLEAERFVPAKQDCDKFGLEPGEAVFIIQRL